LLTTPREVRLRRPLILQRELQCIHLQK
jgi:hypothetical protein